MPDRIKLPDTTGSLNRAVPVLRAIASGPRQGMSMAAIARAVNLPRSTAHRVLASLLQHGWVVRDATSALFNLGADLAEIGTSAIDRHPLRTAAAGDLASLAGRLGEPIYLDVRCGLDMLCVGRFDASSADPTCSGWSGMRAPFGLTPGNMAMLAVMPRAQRNLIVTRNLPRYRLLPGFDEVGFMDSLRHSVARGYGAYSAIVLDRSRCGLGVALFDRERQPVASIGVTYADGHWTRDDRRAAMAHLERAARRISRRLPTRS